MYNKAKKKFFVSFNPALGDLYTLLALTGDTDESIESIFATTRKENEDILLQRYDISKVETAARVVYYHRVLRSFWFRDYETVLNCSKKYDQYNKTKELLRSVDIWMVLFFGIACFVVSRKDNNIRLMSDGEQQLTTMQKWEHACKWNFENKALLLQAEFYYARKEHEQAKACYERSIASAKQHNFLHEEALANEMFGIFCVETGDSARAASVLEEARRLYQQWGAHEKASRLLPL
jgi:tetratricopeptide (TPR) repeat protein